jgi:hypothetical protein
MHSALNIYLYLLVRDLMLFYCVALALFYKVAVISRNYLQLYVMVLLINWFFLHYLFSFYLLIVQSYQLAQCADVLFYGRVNTFFIGCINGCFIKCFIYFLLLIHKSLFILLVKPSTSMISVIEGTVGNIIKITSIIKLNLYLSSGSTISNNVRANKINVLFNR